MKDLKTYASNPFSTLDRIGLEKKKKFGESHLANLAVQNTAQQYDAIIGKTIVVQQNLFGNITDVELAKALQKSQTQSVDAIIEAFSARNTRLNKLLEANDVHKTPLYATFFPQGVTEFTSQVNKGNVEQLMDRMVKVIKANTEVAGGPSVLAEYQAFENNYKTTREMQLTKLGEVSQGIDERNASETAWADQLFDNLLIIAQNNKNNPEIIDSFFDQSIVNNKNNDDDDDTP
ncbi:MAG: hypothetical protein JHD28_00395, partial [Bacteroidia bacterium]|nr:hypothetical protein [Bacteroidia bacterium]